MQKKRPLLTIRPHFDQGLATVQAVMALVVGTILATVIVGTFLFILLSVIGLGPFIAANYIYGLVFVASVVVIPPLFFEIKKKAYQRTVFNFYDDYLDFQYFQFYLSLRRGRIRYRDVTDVTERASSLQSQRRLTSVLLYVPSMRLHRGPFAGITLMDLPVAGDYMARILHLLEGGGEAQASVPEAAIYAPAPEVPPLTTGNLRDGG